jgi:hypothetical protein
VLFRPCQGELRATGRNECPGGRQRTLISDKVRGRDFPFQLDEGSLLFAFSTKKVPLTDNLFNSRQTHVSFNKALCGTLAFAVTFRFFGSMIPRSTSPLIVPKSSRTLNLDKVDEGILKNVILDTVPAALLRSRGCEVTRNTVGPIQKRQNERKSTKILNDINRINRSYRISYSNRFHVLRFLIPLILREL